MAGDQEILVVEAIVTNVVEVSGDVVEIVEVDASERVVIETPPDVEVIEAAVEVIEIVEVAEQGPPGPPGGDAVPYAKRTDFVGADTIYKGEAMPGAADNAPAWRISRIVMSGEDIDERWANGSAAFAHAWSDRESYDYA